MTMVIAGRILEYGHTHFHSGKVYLNNDNLSCPTKTSLEEKCNKLLKELLSEILEEKKKKTYEMGSKRRT